MTNHEINQTLGVRWPIIQAPMAGQAASPELVAAVSNAGGLGSLGAGYMSPQQISEAIARIRQLTDRPFNINLFAIEFPPAPPDISAAIRMLEPFHVELGLPAPVVPPLKASFAEQVRAVLDARVPIFSFTFGVPDGEILQAFRTQGAKVLGTATTVQEGKILEAAGVDGIVAQGSEAGAHRGTFAVPFEQGMVSTLALVPQLARALRVPVIASGGIMDGRGIRAALDLGAAGAQMGTAFLVCPEAGIPEAYRQAILSATDDCTEITRAFSGRPARGIRNRFLRAGAAQPEALLPYPWQNNLTGAMRAAAAKGGNHEMLSLWAGQGAPMARPMPAADLVRTLAQEAEL